MKRFDVRFDVQGESCAAWLYYPDNVGPYPCVILAHGFGGTRDVGLNAYATYFAQYGLAALAFDYRHFGASEGEPRQLLDIRRQLVDWTAAISYARSLNEIDPDRIALWGTSLSGGHVIEIAARDRDIAAVVTVVPFMDGLAILRATKLSIVLRLALAAARDELRNWQQKAPYYIKIVGEPGSLAVMTNPDAVASLQIMKQKNAQWQDDVSARVMLPIIFYRPIVHVSQVICPLLVCVCDNDSVVFPAPAVKAAKMAASGEVRCYAGTHFDLYAGKLFDQTIVDQCMFLTQYLFK